MTKIKNLSDKMMDEICGAKEYAEMYIEAKSKNNIPMANRWKECANDEIKHSNYVHEMIVSEIEELKKVYTPPENMIEKWDKDHKKWMEKTAWIKQMLLM